MKISPIVTPRFLSAGRWPCFTLLLPLRQGLKLVLLSAFLVTAGCTPTVKIVTPEPVKIDMTVKLDIYQKEGPKPPEGAELSIEVAANRRMRLDEVNRLKAAQSVGENRDGYLEVRPAGLSGPALQHATEVVNAENSDRAVLYLGNAQNQSKPLELVQQGFAQIWRDRAKPGEWVQTDQGNWIQK